MAPSIIPPVYRTENFTHVVSKGAKAPLTPSGALEKYPKTQVTPVIGTEFKEGVQVVDLLKAPNSDDLIRDLAILGMIQDRRWTD